MREETKKKRAEAHSSKLKFIKDNYDKLSFYEILDRLQVKESTCMCYHYKLKLKPRRIKIANDERHVICIDWLNLIPVKKLCEMYKYPKIVIFKAIEKELWRLKPTHAMYPRIKKLKLDHIPEKKIIRELDFELYLERVNEK